MPTLLQILRMENKDGYGPFNGLSSAAVNRSTWRNVPWTIWHDWALESADDTHPHHFKDCLRMGDEQTFMADMNNVKPLEGNWLVGCTSVRQFLHWFPKQSLADFQAQGMLLDVYSCPSDAAILGRYQVMFDPSKATLVKTEALTDLANKGTI